MIRNGSAVPHIFPGNTGLRYCLLLVGYCQRQWHLLTLLGLIVLISGCGYRLQNPPPLDEGLAIHISSSDTRLVRSQAYVQDEVARSLRQRFGWDIHPQGGAQLQLEILREDIASAARARRGPTTRWSIEIRVHAQLIRDDEIVLSSRKQGRRSFTGTGYATSRDNEPEALREAAENLAAQLSDWLEHSASRWSTEAL
ncbi:MAG: hypothetical protein EA401_13540 [Planctomycetota bacterium]|nr:MAG: hypothetical protein EA401_13540 [Planctomycetota bacterium]